MHIVKPPIHMGASQYMTNVPFEGALCKILTEFEGTSENRWLYSVLPE